MDTFLKSSAASISSMTYLSCKKKKRWGGWFHVREWDDIQLRSVFFFFSQMQVRGVAKGNERDAQRGGLVMVQGKHEGQGGERFLPPREVGDVFP